MGSTHPHHKKPSSISRAFSYQDYLRRFIFVTILLIPIVFFTRRVNDFFGIPEFAPRKYIQFIIATVITYFSLIFFKHARHEIKAKQYGMMTLVSLAIGAGYLFSAASTFLPQFKDVEFYVEISTLIWVLLFGHYLEARATSVAGDALKAVAKLLPRTAHLIFKNEIKDIDISKLRRGDLILIKPGERFPADGIIIDGNANIDESLISGESKPILKSRNNIVIAGSICIDGALKIKLEKVGKHSTVGQIKSLIEKAQLTKPAAQKIADQASRILTIIAVLVSILTFLAWLLILNETLAFSLTLAITVLVIACPHALGLAIPTVTAITTSLAVKNGLFIKDLGKLEIIRKLNYVIFDKTGTLTEGKFEVEEIVYSDDFLLEQKRNHDVRRQKILQIAVTLEQNATHDIARAVIKAAKKERLNILKIRNFKNFAGKGVSGDIANKTYYIGNEILMKGKNISIENLKRNYDQLSRGGRTVLFVANKKSAIGIIALSDSIKENSFRAISSLKVLGLKIAIISGDNETATKAVASKLNANTYFANVLPEKKYRFIQKLQKKGNIVMMVGDGINDAPAIKQANIGVAIGAGTEVSVEAGDVVLTRNNPEDVVRLIVLGKRVFRKIVENLLWALGYNVIAIPLAAGVLSNYGIFLRPELGAVFMSVSTIIVVLNAMGLGRERLDSMLY